MKFHSIVIFVQDIIKSTNFYIGFLDLKIEYDFGNNVGLSSGISLWQISSGHAIGMQLDTNSKVNRFELYFESENIEKDYKKLKTADVRFLHEIKEESWGQRTMRFFDPDDHLIEVGEPLEVFVLRLYQQQGSIQLVHEKTGVPMEMIRQIISSENRE